MHSLYGTTLSTYEIGSLDSSGDNRVQYFLLVGAYAIGMRTYCYLIHFEIFLL